MVPVGVVAVLLTTGMVQVELRRAKKGEGPPGLFVARPCSWCDGTTRDHQRACPLRPREDA